MIQQCPDIFILDLLFFFLLKGKSLLGYSNFFSNEYKDNDKTILKYFNIFDN